MVDICRGWSVDYRLDSRARSEVVLFGQTQWKICDFRKISWKWRISVVFLGEFNMRSQKLTSLKPKNWWFRNTLLGTNISPPKALLKIIFVVPRWDTLVPWKVIISFATFLRFHIKGLHLPPKNTDSSCKTVDTPPSDVTKLEFPQQTFHFEAPPKKNTGSDFNHLKGYTWVYRIPPCCFPSLRNE